MRWSDGIIDSTDMSLSKLSELVMDREAQFMGLQRVRHGLVTKHQHIHTLVCNLESILKSRDITLPKKVCLVKAMVFLVVMCGCELDYKES